MNFNEYQKKALETAIYPTPYVEGRDPDKYVFLDEKVNVGYVYPALGLVGEAGEVAEKVKKLIRDKQGCFNQEDVEAIKKELGDVLWYVAVLAEEFFIPLEEVAADNIKKLTSRKERDKIHGNGDNR